MNFLSLLAAIISMSFMVSFVLSCKQSASTDITTENAEGGEPAYKEAPMLEPSEFEKGMKKNKAVLVDVRMPQEFEQGHIEGAININFFDPNFKSQLLGLDKSKKFYMYCKNDARSERAAEFMLQNDFPHVYVMKGGYLAWKAAGLK